MDEKNMKDFIHETIIPDKDHRLLNKESFLKSVAAGLVCGLTAILVMGIGAGIWHGAKPESAETVAETEAGEGDTFVDKDTVDAMIQKALKKQKLESHQLCPEAQMLEAVEVIQKSSVSIERESKKQGIFDDAYNTRDSLSGVVVGRSLESYYVLTNASGLNKNDAYQVKFFEGTSVEATLVKKDSGLNLGLLAIEREAVPSEVGIIQESKGSNLQIGQAVIWYGSPSGIQNSLGYGYVSRVGYGIGLPDGNYCGIQTTSPVDSEDGSFLYNLDGKLCGIAFSQKDLPESVQLTEGYGLALSMDSILTYIDAIMEGRKLASLGISGHTVSADMEEVYGMPQGIYITDVSEKSAAFKAGIQVGDVLTSLAGQDIKDMEGYSQVLLNMNIGESVEAVVYRNNKDSYSEMLITVKPGKR